MLKKFSIILLLGFAPLLARGQNLITNSSFENLTDCINNVPCILTKATGWYTPSWNTPDIWNSCFINSFDLPETPAGFQHPLTGNGMGGAGWKDSLNREYLTNRLSETLKPNKGYCISFYINLGDGSYNVSAIDRIGVYFSADSIYYPTFNSLPLVPQVQTDDSVFYADTSGWSKIELFYIAQGNEKFVTIGNFYPDSLTHTLLVTPESIQGYYFIDDVSLVECEVGIEENPFAPVYLYPNPTTNTVTLSYTFKQPTTIEVYSINGACLLKQTIQAGTQNPIVDVSNLANGLYVVRAYTTTQPLFNQRLAIVK